MIYCLLLDETEDLVDRRQQLDERLARYNPPDPNTWGRLPAQQRAMQAAATAIE